MTGRYVRTTFVEDQREFVEHFQNGTQIRELLDMPKGPQAQKTHFFGLNIQKFKKLILLTMCAMKQCWCEFSFFAKKVSFFTFLSDN